MTLRRSTFIFVVTLAVAWSIDRVTKIFALRLFVVYRNYGMTFDILKDSPSTCLFLALTVTGLFALAFAKYRKEFLTPGVAFLLAGALGNLADRLIYGYVVDWIHLVGYINLADIWLCAGALLSLKHIIRT